MLIAWRLLPFINIFLGGMRKWSTASCCFWVGDVSVVDGVVQSTNGW